MKCYICGESMFLKRKVKLLDETICADCFKGFGFSMSDAAMARNLSIDDVAKGRDKLMEELTGQAKKKMVDDALASVNVSFGNYGQERDLDCTEEEQQIYDRVCEILGDSTPRLVRVSNNYVSIKYGEYDLMRFKYTKRARWFSFPMLENGSMKHYIDDLDDLDEYTVVIQDSLAQIKKFNE